MTLENQSDVAKSPTVHEKPLRTRMVEGAVMIAVASLFTMFVPVRPWDPPESLGSRVIALILASCAGAAGGVVYYASDSLRARGGLFKTVANVASILAYCVAAIIFIGGWVYLANPH